MRRRQPRSKRTDTLFPYTTRFRCWSDLPSRPGRRSRPSVESVRELAVVHGHMDARRRVPLQHPGQEGGADGRKHGVGQDRVDRAPAALLLRSEEHTSELQSLMRISYAVFCLKTKNNTHK